MSPAMFGHSSSPQNALLGSATLAPLRWCLIIFGHFGIVGAIWGVGSTCWVQLLTYTVHFEEFRWASFLQTLHQKLTVSCGDVLLCCCWVILRRPQWSSIQPSASSPRWLSQLYTLWLLGDDLPAFLEVFASEPSRLRTLHKPMWHHEMPSVAWVYRIYHDGIWWDMSSQSSTVALKECFSTKRR